MKAAPKQQDYKFEQNQKQFLEENPYGCSLEQTKGRNASLSKERSQRGSAYEKYNDIRFQCIQIDENITSLGSTLEMIHYDPNQEIVQMPLELFQKMQEVTQQLSRDFKGVQNQWSDFFDQQQEVNQKYRGKSKTYKKKLNELENQSIIYMKDQKEFEKSLVDITKEHDLNKDKMGLVLDQMESQVSELKNTRQSLNVKYESQLDKAVKEMMNFYNNLEADDDKSDDDFLDKVFFIKPTRDIELRIQSSTALGLKQISETDLKKAPAIPRIPMEKLQKRVDSPKILSKEEDLKPANEEEDYVTNPVMVQAMHQTSKFDQKYEDDFEGANITLDMCTSRLAQFPEEYEMLQHIQDPDQRIIMKQMVFFKYEKKLKKQAKAERKKLKKQKKLEAEQQKQAQAQATSNRSLVPTPTNRSAFAKFGQQKKYANLSSKSSQKQLTKTNGLNIGNKQVNDANEYTGMVTSRFSMQSELPSIDTIECISAQQRFQGQDVNNSEIFNCEQELVHGLKSCTQVSLIRKIEEEFRQKEIIRDKIKADEKKLNYSSSTQSKISLLNKQVSQGSIGLKEQMLAKNYASNNSNSNSNPKLVVVDSEYSMNSNVQIQKQSKKRLSNLQVDINLGSGYDQNMPSNLHFGGEMDPNDLSQITPSDVKIKIMESDKVDESFLSANSQYQRFFDQNQESESKCSGYPSPQVIQNSYIQSSNQSQDNHMHQDQTYNDEPSQPEEHDVRKRLPLDVIQERQSEFSQSMMTNAAKLNSHRSRQNIQYNNMSRATQNGLPTGRSDVNKSSSRKQRPPLCDMDDYKNYNYRAGSQAQTSRNAGHGNSVEQAFTKNSRNEYKKVSKSSHELVDQTVLKKQPSAGKIENRQKFLQNFEHDINDLMPSFNVQKAPIPIACKQKSSQRQTNNYVNLTIQNSQLCSERDNYMPNSQRSHVGESLKNRSYFDESPALFDADGSNIDISAQRDTSKVYESLNSASELHQMQSIAQSNSATRQEPLKKEPEKKTQSLIRSSSECQLRDKEFYEMCDEDDEIAMFCKFAEQNIVDNMHVRNLSAQYHQKNGTHLHNQSSDNQTQFCKSNQLVFLSQQTFNRLSRGNGVKTIQKLNYDPTRLLASAHGIQANGPQVNTYLGTNLLTNSLDAATTLLMHNQIMMPTHQYNRRTLLMMQNLHNNYLYSHNSGILFTMQRGWNSGQSQNVSTNPQIGIGHVFKNLLVDQKNSSVSNEQKDEKSFGGDPVNISNLLLGAKQQTSEQINVGSVTIVDDDGKLMMDRKLLMEANNSSHQTNARRLFSLSRNIYGQVTTSDFSNLQTKQLGILRNNLRPQTAAQMVTASRNFKSEGFDNIGNSKNSELYEVELVEPTSEKESKKKVDQNRIMNLITGLKQIQMKQQTRPSTDLRQPNRPISDLSTEQQNVKKISAAKWSQDQGPRIISASGDIDSQTSHGNLTTAKQAKKGINAGGLQNLKNMIKIQQKQNQMNLSQSIQLNNDLLHKQHLSGLNFKTVVSQKNIVKIKSKSQPKNESVIPPKKEDITQKNHELIDEIRKLQGYKTGHTQNSSDLSVLQKKNKLKVQNVKYSNINFNTISNNSEKTIKEQNLQNTRHQNYSTVQSSQKLGSFLTKKNSYQGVPTQVQKSARQSSQANVYVTQGGKLSIKKKILNQQISMPNSLI